MSSLSVYRKPRMKRRGATRMRRRIPGKRVQVRRVRRPNRVNRMIGVKRRYGRTATVTKRRRTTQSSGTQEYSRYLTKIGRYTKRTLRNAWKRINVNQSYVVLRWNAVKAWNTNGYYWMQNRTISGFKFCPMYLFNLSSCNNSAANAEPCLQLTMNTVSGAFVWVQKDAFTNNGTSTATTWQYEQLDTGNGLPGSHSFLKWADIRMNLWGCKNKATRWVIQLIRFKDPLCDPYEFRSDESAGSVVTNNRNDLYQSMVAPFMFNPIHHVPSTLTKRIKVYKSWVFVQDPTTTIENDADPKCKEFRLFHRFNKMIKWANINTGLANVNNLDKSGFDYSAGSVQNNCYAPPGKNYCLLIRALNCDEDAADLNTVTPSFDLSVRTKHQYDAQ